ncbi:glycoside hydrolase family 105 protein, partial [Piromyces sp. E2]
KEFGWHTEETFNSDNDSDEETEAVQNSIVFNIKDNLDEEKTIKVSTLEEFDYKSLKKDGYHFVGAYSDSDYTNYFDFSNITQQAYDIYVKYEVKEPFQKQENIDLNEFVEALIEKTTSFIPYWDKEFFKGKWNYIDGVFLNSVLNLYKNTGNEKYKEFFIRYINYFIAEDGTFVYYNADHERIVDNSMGYTEGELDTVCASKVLFDAYEMTNDPRYLTAIEYTYNQLMQMPICNQSPNFWHKTFYIHQIWLDGMYMYGPFLARYALLKNDLSILDTIKSQYEYIQNHMMAENGLYYHGYDTTKTIFWSQENDGRSSNFWLRSMGWFSVSIVDIVDYYPDGENKEFLLNLLNDLLNSLLNFQDETTKMFYQVVDRAEEIEMVDNFYFNGLNNLKYGNIKTLVANYAETSGSSMFAYTFMKFGKKYQNEYFKEIGREVFESVFQHSYKNKSLSNICITAGLGPENKTYRDGTLSYYLAEKVGSDDAKGVGPFIMAYIEYTY